MKILLVYPDVKIHVNFPVGLGIISSCLKNAGHEVKIMHLNEEVGKPYDLDQAGRTVAAFKPDFIAFSTTTGQFKYVKELAAVFKKKHDAPILAGGIHPTIAPEEVLATGTIDLACLGEGEETIVELAQALASGGDYQGIRNLAYQHHGKTVINPLRPLVADLNALPFPDRQGFDFGRIVDSKNGWANLMAGRGCLYHCTYCVNNYFHKIYQEYVPSKSHMRIRTVETVMAEVDGIRTDFPNTTLINFDDDIFTLDRQWLTQFCAEYKKTVNLPFACNIQVMHFSDEIARMLYDAGCREVKIGLESGNDELRRKILKRHMSNDTIVKAFKSAEDAGIRAWTFNMIGPPGETPDTIMDTVRLNARIRPYILRCSIFYPYQGTDLYTYCQEHGLLDDGKNEDYTSHLEGSILRLQEISEAELIRAKVMFKWLVDSESAIESAPLFKGLVEWFSALPPEQWLDGTAQKQFKEVDLAIGTLLKGLKKEHYSSRRHLDLNFTERLGFELP